MILPDAWVDELARTLDPDAFAPPPRLHLPLTHRMGLAQRLDDIGATIEDVQAELANGFTSDRRNGSNGEYYCLSATRFDVFVSSQPADESGLPLAVVTAVKPVRRLANRDGLASPTVSFHLPYEEMTCDVATVHRAVERLRAQRQRQRRARDRARDVLARPRVDGRRAGHSELHAQALRHYSTLLTVIDLLKERSETEGVVRVSGTILNPADVAAAADESLVCINLDRAVDAFRQGLEVDVESGDGFWTLEVVVAEDRLLCLEPPERGDLAPGARVRLEYQETFRLRRHSYALKRFREEDVVGDWSALARLLCAPDTLTVPAARSTLTHFDPNLNRRQRAAVAGAVDAPHAFFVQGPPGTGKTTVITEIVRQLVGRGERVLLVASMHVAVDEVLRRVAEADGVFALRYSVNDSKVRDKMRRFLPEYVTAEFARRAARPAQSKAPRWRAEIDRLVDEENRLRAALAARLAQHEASARHATTIQARQEFQSAYAASMTSADSTAAYARQRREKAHAHWVVAHRAERALDAELAAMKATQNLWNRLAGLFGGGPLRPLKQRYKAAFQALARAHAEHEALARVAAQARAHQEAVAHQGVSGLPLHDQACVRSEYQLRTAEQRLSEAHDRMRPLLPKTHPAMVSDDDLTTHAQDRRTRTDRLERYIKLEHRWHQIVGFTDQSPTVVEQVLAKMGEELLQAANLVCCTTTGFGGQPDIRDTDFDTIIVDEASRVTDSEFLIGARQARRWILVGDEHQLPPYVHSPDEHHLHALAALHMTERGAAPNLKSAVKHLNTLWREDEELHQLRTDPVQKTAERLRDNGRWRRIYRPAFQAAYQRLGRDDTDADRALLGAMRTHLVQSLFERCVQACPPALCERLTEQRRMIDPIAAIVRKPVYGGDYHSPPPADLLAHGVSPLIGETLREPVVLLDTSDQPKADEEQRGTGFINKLEADWAVTVCRLWERELRRRGEQDQITASVLTLYGAQAKLIRAELGHPHYPDFRALKIEKIDSIDAIQGQESDLVLLSFCRTRRGKMGDGFGLWLQDVRRLNVACTRARRSLVLIGHRHTLERLSTIDGAKAFYSHLFSLFDQKNPGTVVLRDLRSRS
jgi:hypothetical protein